TRQLFDLRRGHAVSNLPVQSDLAGQGLTARLEHGNDTGAGSRAPPAADIKRRRAQDLSLCSHGQLGGAAADIDVENATLSLSGEGDCAGAVGRKQRFEIVAGAGADKVATLRGEEVGDGPGVVPANRFAGENDGAGVHLL